jgi:hypothetical protein
MLWRLLLLVLAFQVVEAEAGNGQRSCTDPVGRRQTGTVRLLDGIRGIAFILKDGSKGLIPVTAGQGLIAGLSRLEDGSRVSFTIAINGNCEPQVRGLLLN